MAGVVGGATGAAIAAIVIIFEMTLDYNVIVPMTLTVAVSYGVRRVICQEGIYTMKLARRGHTIPGALQANFPQHRRARHIMDTRLSVVPASTPVAEFARLAADRPQIQWYLLEEAGRVERVVAREAIRDDLDADVAGGPVSGLASRNFVFVRPGAALLEEMADLFADR